MLRRITPLLPILLTLAASRTAAASSSETEDSNDFRADVLACEESLAHLERCCPGLDARQVRCFHYEHAYTDSGCDSYARGGSTFEHPALSAVESACIMQASCEELQSRGVCGRAQRALPDRTSSSWSDDPAVTGALTSTSSPDVCP